MIRQPRFTREAGITRFEERHARKWVWIGALAVLGVLLLWVGIPVVRLGLLLGTSPFRAAPARPAGLVVKSVRFQAADGVPLRGWFVPASASAPTVILIAGFKADRTSMVPYARFLHAARFNVLLYDSRGTGASSGTFGLGLREVQDVLGAADYLRTRTGLHDHRYGLLGVSLGAGVAIVAGSRLPTVAAIVADSPYADQELVVQRVDTLRVGPLSLPLAPIGPWLADRILGARLASFSPLRSARKFRSRGLLLIHGRHDRNSTTPLRAARALLHADPRHAVLWIAARGGHAGALAAQPGQYRHRVLAFLRRYLR